VLKEIIKRIIFRSVQMATADVLIGVVHCQTEVSTYLATYSRVLSEQSM